VEKQLQKWDKNLASQLLTMVLGSEAWWSL